MFIEWFNGTPEGESFNLFNYKTNTIDWKKAEKEIYIKDINNKNIIIRIWRRYNTFYNASTIYNEATNDKPR